MSFGIKPLHDIGVPEKEGDDIFSESKSQPFEYEFENSTLNPHFDSKSGLSFSDHVWADGETCRETETDYVGFCVRWILSVNIDITVVIIINGTGPREKVQRLTHSLTLVRILRAS